MTYLSFRCHGRKVQVNLSGQYQCSKSSGLEASALKICILTWIDICFLHVVGFFLYIACIITEGVQGACCQFVCHSDSIIAVAFLS